MTSLQELMNHLKSIMKLLKEEKQALLYSDGNKVAGIVESKTKLIEKLESFKGLNIEDNVKVMSLIEEMNSLQETNLLLTKQALSYQNTLLESIAKNIQNMSNTYSAKGSYESNNGISLVDQSV